MEWCSNVLDIQNANHPHQMLFHHPFPWLLCCYGFSETRCYEAVNVISVNCNVTASKDCSKTFIMEDNNETFIVPWFLRRGQDEGYNCLCIETLMEIFFVCKLLEVLVGSPKL
jgi:hypothetical protein